MLNSLSSTESQVENDDGYRGTAFAAVAETTSFLHYFSGLPVLSSGQQSGLSAAVGAAPDLSGGSCGEGFTDIARFASRKIELLRRFRPYVNGTPSHDHLGDIFATLDARAFQLCFVACGGAANTPAEVISIDGKTSRRSYQTKGSKEAIHIVSAFAARQRIVLGQVKVNEKSNEIVPRHPGAARHDVDRGRGRDDRCDGLPANIAAKIIEKGRLDIALEAMREPCARMSRFSPMSRKP